MSKNSIVLIFSLVVLVFLPATLQAETKERVFKEGGPFGFIKDGIYIIDHEKEPEGTSGGMRHGGKHKDGSGPPSSPYEKGLRGLDCNLFYDYRSEEGKACNRGRVEYGKALVEAKKKKAREWGQKYGKSCLSRNFDLHEMSACYMGHWKRERGRPSINLRERRRAFTDASVKQVNCEDPSFYNFKDRMSRKQRNKLLYYYKSFCYGGKAIYFERFLRIAFERGARGETCHPNFFRTQGEFAACERGRQRYLRQQEELFNQR